MKLLKGLLLIPLLAMFILPFSSAATAGETTLCDKSAVHVENNYTAWVDGEACTAYLATYILPDTWNGDGWNETATPQTLFAAQEISLTSEKKTFTPTFPECGAVQVDIMTTVPPGEVTWPGIPGGVVKGTLFYLDTQCQVDKKPTEVGIKGSSANCKNPGPGLWTPVYNKDEATVVKTEDTNLVTFTFTAKDGFFIKGETEFSGKDSLLNPARCNPTPPPPVPPCEANPNSSECLPPTGAGSLIPMGLTGLGLLIAGGLTIWKTRKPFGV